MDNAPPFPFERSLPHPMGSPSGPAASGFERRDRGGLRRLRDMRFADIAYRGWHEASRWIVRVAPVEQPEHFEALLRRHAPELAEPAAALRILREVAPTRFFAGAAEPGTAAALSAALPAHRAEV